MNRRHLLKATLAGTGLLAAVEADHSFAQAGGHGERRIRFINNTDDILSARLVFVQRHTQRRVVIDARRGFDDTQSGQLGFGDRGIIIYDNATKKVIATSHFEYSSGQPKIFISLSNDPNNSGYFISPGADP